MNKFFYAAAQFGRRGTTRIVLVAFSYFFSLFASFFAEKQLNVIEELCDECKTEHTREIEFGVQQQRNWTLFAVTSDIV